MKNIHLLLCAAAAAMFSGCCCCCPHQPPPPRPHDGLPPQVHDGARLHFNYEMQQGIRPNHGQPPMWFSNQPAAPDSLEAQWRAQGKHWVKTPGKITVGAYVQDILEGRLNQPRGRGAIGKVVSVLTGDRGQPVAKVDFGRDYVANINFSELSLVKIVPR